MDSPGAANVPAALPQPAQTAVSLPTEEDSGTRSQTPPNGCAQRHTNSVRSAVDEGTPRATLTTNLRRERSVQCRHDDDFVFAGVLLAKSNQLQNQAREQSELSDPHP